MKEKEKRLSEEQLDFLREMMNIGAGNAVTAFRFRNAESQQSSIRNEKGGYRR